MYLKVSQNESSIIEDSARQQQDRRESRRSTYCLFLTLFVLVSGSLLIGLYFQLSNTVVQENIDSNEENSNQDILPETDEEEDAVQVPEIDSSSSPKLSLLQKCPNWSSEFALKYESECGYWIDKFEKWEENTHSNAQEVAYVCTNERLCHGWGDRIGGIGGAFFKAVHGNFQFRIGHEGLHSIFTPCLLKQKTTNWALHKNYAIPNEGCVHSQGTPCKTWLALSCHGAMVARDFDRSCFYDTNCQHLLRLNRALSAVHTVGCGLRAMFEPSNYFLNEMKIAVRFGMKEPEEMTMSKFEKFVNENYVISLHIRMGDGVAFGHAGTQSISADHEEFRRSFRCAQTLESFIASNHEHKGKKIYWFLASDSLKFRQVAMSAFPDKIITLDIKPEHVAFNGKSKNEVEGVVDTVTEWYAIGLGRDLILNRLGGTHEFRDMFHGRVSGYPKTSWVYHLKHMVYDAGRCEQYSLGFEGIWGDLAKKSCTQSTLIKGRTQFPQDHLKPIHDANLTFPFAWVENGEVLQLSEDERPIDDRTETAPKSEDDYEPEP